MSAVEIVAAGAEELRAYGERRFADAYARSLYAGDRAFVARDDGTVIGACIARDTRDERMVAELFVEPSFGRMGIGARLLEAALADADDRTCSALVPVREPALAALLARAGIAALAPVYRLAGAIPEDDDLLAIAGAERRFGTRPIEPGRHAVALAQLDREVRGGERDADHRLLEAIGASGIAFSIDEELAGYAYVHPSGTIGPVAAASAAYMPPLLAYAMATLRREFGASWCATLVPGADLRGLRSALRAGLRIEETFAFASDGRMHDLSRYLGMHALLF